MFLYVVKQRLLESIGSDTDMLVIHAFDAHGEVHGRASFQWALDIPGAIDQTRITSLEGVANLQGEVEDPSMYGSWNSFLVQIKRILSKAQ